jgi:hypothetical protein
MVSADTARTGKSTRLYCGWVATQYPPRHDSEWSQQLALEVHFSSSIEQPRGTPHLPDEHEPPHQSRPVSHPEPFPAQGASTGNARILPLPTSCPGR